MQSDVVAEVGVAALGLGDVLGAVAEDLGVELGQGHAGLDHLLPPVGQHDRGPAGSLCLAGEVGVLAELAHALQACRGGHSAGDTALAQQTPGTAGQQRLPAPV